MIKSCSLYVRKLNWKCVFVSAESSRNIAEISTYKDKLKQLRIINLRDDEKRNEDMQSWSSELDGILSITKDRSFAFNEAKKCKTSYERVQSECTSVMQELETEEEQDELSYKTNMELIEKDLKNCDELHLIDVKSHDDDHTAQLAALKETLASLDEELKTVRKEGVLSLRAEERRLISLLPRKKTTNSEFVPDATVSGLTTAAILPPNESVEVVEEIPIINKPHPPPPPVLDENTITCPSENDIFLPITVNDHGTNMNQEKVVASRDYFSFFGAVGKETNTCKNNSNSHMKVEDDCSDGFPEKKKKRVRFSTELC